jgi:TIR domain-containing protein
MLRQPHIFISFKSEEHHSAAALKVALEQGGFAVWWQEDIQCGREWHGDIDSALLSSGCVVVLWSPASIVSPWVRHEASQAVARGVYTPVRLVPMEIGSPFDRIQATDLFGWNGEPNHPGLLRLLGRADELIPQPLSPAERTIRSVRRNLLAIATSAIAVAAMGMLVYLSFGLEKQLAAQASIAQSIQRTLHPLSNIRVFAFLEIDADVPGVQAYLNRLQGAVPLSPEGILKRNASLPSGVLESRSSRDEVEELSIPYGSALWPADTASSWLGTVARYPELEISFSRSGHESQNEIDLSFFVGAHDPDGSEGQRNTAAIHWELKTGKLTVDFTDTSAQQYWRSNGEISSTLDLESSTIKIAIESIMYNALNDSAAIAGTQASRRGLRLNTIFLDVSGRSFMIRASALKSSVNAQGMRVYTGEFTQAVQKPTAPPSTPLVGQ